MQFSTVIKKQVRGIPKRELNKIKELIALLQENPRPANCKKLVGGQTEYRIRYGDWRVLYTVDDSQKNVVVYGILHRKEAYR